MTSTTCERREQIAAFYTAHAARLHTTLRRSAHAPEAVIEDACQSAWTILVRRPDVSLDERGLAWLATVAIREAWRLASTARETPVDRYQGSGGEELRAPSHLDERSAEQRVLERLEHAERVQALATLKPREREALFLHGMGHSYEEIARLTDSSRTAVNRRISEGRAALRRGGTMTASTRRSMAIE